MLRNEPSLHKTPSSSFGNRETKIMVLGVHHEMSFKIMWFSNLVKIGTLMTKLQHIRDVFVLEHVEMLINVTGESYIF